MRRVQQEEQDRLVEEGISRLTRLRKHIQLREARIARLQKDLSVVDDSIAEEAMAAAAIFCTLLLERHK